MYTVLWVCFGKPGTQSLQELLKSLPERREHVDGRMKRELRERHTEVQCGVYLFFIFYFFSFIEDGDGGGGGRHSYEIFSTLS